MTSRLSFSYGREVYALPGRVDDMRSQGCNHLIREKIAEPITSTKDLIESLGFKSARTRATQVSDKVLLENTYASSIPSDKISQMAKILLTVRKTRGIAIEDLASETGMDYIRTVELVRILETDGFISMDLLQRCTINIRK